MHERIIELSRAVSTVTTSSLDQIESIMQASKMLSINALIEAAHAGEHGRGFAVVAKEVGEISKNISTVTHSFRDRLSVGLRELDQVSAELLLNARGTRLADLALNMIDIIDRNLYERSCDVRWWATDSAVVNCVASDDEAARTHCSERLGVILDAYTVYRDIWIAGPDGRVLATGRPNKYPGATTANVSNDRWFINAMHTNTGADFVVDNVTDKILLGGKIATYATAIRAGGQQNGKAIGAIGIHFDWDTQSQAVIDRVRLLDNERAATRCMLVEPGGRVIASTGGQGVLTEEFTLRTAGKKTGFYTTGDNTLVGFALTPGYETYAGLGWYGVITQPLHATAQPKRAA